MLAPLTLMGNLSVPAVLLAFGISLRGSALPGRSAERHPVLLSVVLKSVTQPVVAWVLGAWVFRLAGADLLDVVVIAALPAAQNLFAYASRYQVAGLLAREASPTAFMAWEVPPAVDGGVRTRAVRRRGGARPTRPSATAYGRVMRTQPVQRPPALVPFGTSPCSTRVGPHPRAHDLRAQTHPPESTTPHATTPHRTIRTAATIPPPPPTVRR